MFYIKNIFLILIADIYEREINTHLSFDGEQNLYKAKQTIPC